MAASELLCTPRLRLQAPDPAQADVVADFYRRNAQHFAPWDPPLQPGHADPDTLHTALVDGRAAFDSGRAHRWWMALADDPDRVIGSVHLSGIVRGAFHNAMLGYSLDAGLQGRGLMHEALTAAVAEAFGPGLNLHRIQAAVRPENARSLAVLARLGFADEGLARAYLYIDGGWRDHRIFARTNPDFAKPPHW